jgi:hypothetical protein
MVKGTRKSSISPETRQEWFERHRLGDSIAEIKKTTKIGVRTIRKHIEIARREHEINLANADVLRNAIQDHNHDLCVFAKKIDEQIKSETSVLPQLKEDPLWLALYQHLPRSIIWKNLDKWPQLISQISLQSKKLDKLLETKTRAQIKSNKLSQDAGFEDKLVRILDYWIKRAIHTPSDNLENPDFDETLKKEDPGTIKLVKDVFNEITKSLEYNELKDSTRESKKVYKLLHEQFLIITLRRVVPGKCHYCPV